MEKSHVPIQNIELTAVKLCASGCCPRCGKAKLYACVLKPAQSCSVCDLDYGSIDAGKGPVLFVFLIIGFFVAAPAKGLQTEPSLPIWVPLIFVPPVLFLCFSRGILVALQYKTNPRQCTVEDTS